MILRPSALDAASFAPFGDVVQTDKAMPILINNGNTERFDSLAQVETNGPDDRAVISIFRALPRQLPMQVSMLERHPKGSQSFHPLSGQPYLVLVADAVEKPDAEHLHLFLAQGDQGINYHKNTWHHPILALNTTCDFLVVDRKGSGNNCEEIRFADTTITIAL